MQHLFHTARIMPVHKAAYRQKGIDVSVLRLDEIHPVVSGNKWFKLKAYLDDAARQQKKAILTFGGAYSNHIIATAAACAQHGFQSIGIIRGERPVVLSPTLQDALQYGMQLYFVSRETYRTKAVPPEVYGVLKKEAIYEIAEGGYGNKGAEGSMDILKSGVAENFTHIIAAVGTGTMLAGLARAAAPHQQVIGVSVLKNNVSAQASIQKLIHGSGVFRLIHDYYFGGYAKHTPQLLQFMNDWYSATGIPTDFVYTAKTFFAAEQLVAQEMFKPGSSVLLVHSGGLQGNRSLPRGALQF